MKSKELKNEKQFEVQPHLFFDAENRMEKEIYSVNGTLQNPHLLSQEHLNRMRGLPY